MALRNAATVFGASWSSKRAWKVNSPARTINWLIDIFSWRIWRACENGSAISIAAGIGGSKDHSSSKGRFQRRPGAAALLPPVIGPAENAAALRLGFRGRRCWHFPDFGLRRGGGWGRHGVAFHRGDQLTLRGSGRQGATVDH